MIACVGYLPVELGDGGIHQVAGGKLTEAACEGKQAVDEPRAEFREKRECERQARLVCERVTLPQLSSEGLGSRDALGPRGAGRSWGRDVVSRLGLWPRGAEGGAGNGRGSCSL